MSGPFLALSMASLLGFRAAPDWYLSLTRLPLTFDLSPMEFDLSPMEKKIWKPCPELGVGEFQTLGLTLNLSPTDGTEAC
jgi:hypothetical protein